MNFFWPLCIALTRAHTVLVELGRATDVSHHDRRRSNDQMAPCESTNPLDTTDDDCYTARWNLMVSYFPAHTGLQEMDGKIVQGQAEIEAAWTNIENQLQLSAQAIHGVADGGTDGLIWESQRLADAAAQLQRASIASFDKMSQTQINFTQTASNDYRNLKDYLAGAFSDLSNKTNTAVDMQAKSQAKNAALMNSQATTALGDSVDILVSTEKNMSSSVGAAQGQLASVTNAFTYVSGQLGPSTGSLSDQVASLGSNADSSATATSQAISDSIDGGQSQVESNGNDLNSIALKQMTAVAGDVTQQSSDQLGNTSAGWKNMSDTMLDGAQSRVNLTTNLVAQNLSITGSASVSADRLAQQIDTQQAAVESNTQQVVVSTAAVSNDTAARASDMDSWASDVDSQTIDIDSDTQAQVATAQQTVSNARNSLNTPTGSNTMTLQQLLDALSSVQSQSSASLSGSQSDGVASVADLLASVGSTGIDASGSLSGLANSITAGQTDGSEQLQNLLGQGAAIGQNLTSQIDDTVALLSTIPQIGSPTMNLPNSDQITELGNVTSTGQIVAWNMKQSVDQKLSQSDSISSGSTDLTSSLHGTSRSSANLKHTVISLADTDSDSGQIYSSQLARADDQVGGAMGAAVRAAATRINQTGTTNTGLDKLARAGWKELAQAKSKQDDLVGSLEAQESSTEASNADTQQRVNTINAGLGPPDVAGLQQRFADQLSSQPGGMTGISTVDENEVMDAIRPGVLVPPYSSSDNKLATLSPSPVDNTLAALSIKQKALSKTAPKQVITANGTAVLSNVTKFIEGFQSRSTALAKELKNANATFQAQMINLTSQTRAELARIPSELLSLGLGDNFDSLTSKLNDQILLLQEKLAVANTTAEINADTAGLVVLDKLQAVQQGAQAADDQVRNNLSSSAAQKAAAAGMSQEAIKALGASMTVMSDNLDTPNTWDSSDMQLLTKQVTGRLALVLSASQSGLEANMSTATLGQGLALAAARHRTAQTSNTTYNLFSLAFSNLSNHLESSNNLVSTSGNLTNFLSQVSANSSLSIGEVLSDVMTRVQGGVGMLNNTATASDVSAQLMVVRKILKSFLGLWHDYGSSVEAQLASIVRGDDDFINGIAQNAQTELDSDQGALNMARNSMANFTQESSGFIAGEQIFKDQLNSISESIKTDNRSVVVANLMDGLDNIDSPNSALGPIAELLRKLPNKASITSLS